MTDAKLVERPVSRPAAPVQSARHRRRIGSVVLAGPALLLMTAFVVLPAAGVGALALIGYDPLAGHFSFVGLDNFRRVFSSGELLQATVNTMIYTVLTVPGTTIAGLAIALAINSLDRGAAVWRSIYFLPVASMLTAMAVVWHFMFYPESGVVDTLFGSVSGTDWLSSSSLALLAITVVGFWSTLGFAVVMFLAGLSAVPAHLHEVAALDGAGLWSRFWHVTVPAIGPAAVFTVVISLRDALRVFDQVKVMTDGGPLGATQTLSVLLWRRGIEFLDIGGASVVNLVLLVILAGAMAVQLRTFGRRWEQAGSR